MKRKLLILMVAVLSSATYVNAQTVWNFGNDAINWPGDLTGYTTNVVKQNLGIYPAALESTTIGQVDLNNTTFADSFSATQRFKMGGTSTVEGNKPTVRFIYFAVASAGSVKIWFRGGNSTTTRTLSVSDGTNLLGSAASVNGATTILDVPYTITSGNIYIYNDLACNIYKIEVTGSMGTTGTIILGVNDFNADAASNVFSNGKEVFVSNVKSSTQIEVYSVTGALVKSLQTDADTSFSLNSGLYVVKAKSAEGSKSVKVVVE